MELFALFSRATLESVLTEYKESALSGRPNEFQRQLEQLLDAKKGAEVLGVS
jgi:hypothetical protein